MAVDAGAQRVGRVVGEDRQDIDLEEGLRRLPAGGQAAWHLTLESMPKLVGAAGLSQSDWLCRRLVPCSFPLTYILIEPTTGRAPIPGPSSPSAGMLAMVS